MHVLQSQEPSQIERLLSWIRGLWEWQRSLLYFILATLFVSVGSLGLWGVWAGMFAAGAMLLVLSITWSDGEPPNPPTDL